ncbi:MAG: hypothetical protein GY913_02130 [Proteobacteria bacterium]|nr:hypothetical protein [Pseudomonadota bacterium]MCP4915697.1 hypothetical protein [Pseudomonadota bacterium]
MHRGPVPGPDRPDRAGDAGVLSGSERRGLVAHVEALNATLDGRYATAAECMGDAFPDMRRLLQATEAFNRNDCDAVLAELSGLTRPHVSATKMLGVCSLRQDDLDAAVDHLTQLQTIDTEFEIGAGQVAGG